MNTIPKNSTTATPSPGVLRSQEAAARQRLSRFATMTTWLENEAVLGYVLMAPALLLIVVFIA